VRVLGVTDGHDAGEVPGNTDARATAAVGSEPFGYRLAVLLPPAPVSGEVAVDYGQELVNIERLRDGLSGSVCQQLIDDVA
jgi:hypothetical protein